MAEVPPKKPTGLDKAFAFLAPPQRPDEIGRLGEYRVLKLLGKGGMGMVFKAEDPQLERAIALKIMLPQIAENETARDRFLREARAAAKLEHDHVIAIYQVGQDRGIPFIAMPFLKGMSLEDWLRRKRPLTMGQILRIGREIARGLQAAHERGLIHRDIKPANLWLDAASDGRIKILDFGLARPEKEDTGLTRSGQIVGTPTYMSPEQAEGKKIDGRSDLFSLGVVLYRLCTGVLPFRGPNIMAVLMALATQDPPAAATLHPEVPAAFSELIARLMRKKPEDRPASAKEVVDAIAAIERNRIQTARTGLDVAPPTVAVDSFRAAASQVFKFDESSDSDLSDEDFEAARRGKDAKAEPGRPTWLRTALYGAAALGVLAVLGVVCILAMSRSAAPPLESVRAKPVADPHIVPDPPKKEDSPPGREEDRQSYLFQLRGERQIFNGKDLAGWSCDPKVWQVENGEIVAGLASSQPGTDSDLIPPGQFTDFELTFEVRSSRKSKTQNCQLTPRFVDYKMPFVILGIEDPGWIFDGNPDAFKVLQQPSPAMTKAIRMNDYNEMTVRVIGNKLTLIVDGVAGEPVEYPMAAEGRIKWHYSAHSDSLRIRKIRLVDLSAPTASPVLQSRPLFNGKDLDGWKCDPAVWHVENGMIVAAHGKTAENSELTPPGRFGDFELTFQARGVRTVGGQASLLKLRTEEKGTRFLSLVLEEPGWIYSGILNKSLDFLAQPKQEMIAATRPREFNAFVVRVVGHRLTLTVNGVPAAPVDFTMPSQGQLHFVFGKDSSALQLRDIRLVELRQPRPLFNGKDLTGWTHEQSRWRVDKDEIVGTSTDKPGSHELIAPGRFGDFELTFEAKSTFGSYDHSHLLLRIDPPDASVEPQKPHTLPVGMESLSNVYTIEGEWKFKNVRPVSPTMKKAGKPNEYNTFVVRYVDGELTVRLNGVPSEPLGRRRGRETCGSPGLSTRTFRTCTCARFASPNCGRRCWANGNR